MGINFLLAAIKVIVGLACRSQALLADGFHSATDLITDALVLAGLRVSEKPADSCHPYGHQRVSTLVAMSVGALLAVTAVGIAYRAITTLHQPHESLLPTLPFWIAAGSIPIKELLFQVTRRVGERTGNTALLANAWHHRSDALTSVAAAAGLAGAAFGGPSWAFLDHVTAVVLSVLLLTAASKIVYRAAAELVDQAPEAETLGKIEEVVAQTAGVESYHAVRARRLGGKIDMDIHIQVAPDLTVQEGHDIARAVRQRVLRGNLNVQQVIVHVEPAEARSGS
jgi:cation diffusion facilitator family transporter